MIAFVLLCGLAAPVAPGPAGAYTANCGVSSVAALAEALGRPLAGDDERRMAAEQPAAQVSMAEVRALAGGLGLALTGFEATLDELAARGGPAILHLREPDHFTCLVGLDAEWAQLLDDWPARLVVVPRAELAGRYTGRCLLPDEAPAGGPRVAVEQCHTEFEQATAGVQVSHSFRLTNTGAAPLHLRSSSSSCSCATVGRLVEVIEPGASVPVPVTYRPTPGRGHLEHIRLATDDPARPVVYLSIRVQDVPQNIAIAPPALHLGLEAGGRAVTQFRIIGPPDLQVRAALSEPDICEARILKLEADDRRRVYTLQVNSLGGLRCGRHEARLLVTTDTEGAEALAVPVTVLVTDAAQVRPARVADIRLEPGPYEREFRVRSLGLRMAEVLEVRIEGLPLEVTGIQRESPASYLIRLGGRVTEGVWRGRMVVVLDLETQPELVVPITLAIQAD